MKKKPLTLFALIACCAFALGGVACKDKKPDASTSESSLTVETSDSSISSHESAYSGISSHESASEESSSSSEIHTHDYTLLTKDDEGHWYECTCGEKSAITTHVYGAWETVTPATCTEEGKKTHSCACGATEEATIEKTAHTFASEWSKDKTYHWYAATCGHVEEVREKAEHTFDENNICTVCQKSIYTEGLKYTLSDDGTYYIVVDIGTATDTDILIPPTYNDLPVASIGDRAFYARNRLTSVTIPDGIVSIGDEVFSNCMNLTSVTIPDGVISIGQRAFEYCKFLTSITIPGSVTFIGELAFSECDKLVEVINKSSLTITEGSGDNGRVGYYAKRVITNEADSGIIKQDNYIFYNDNGSYYLLGYEGSATELVLPDTINGNTYAIYQYAFSGCSITSIIIPDGVISIGQRAFEYCRFLTSITIPDSVTSIGDWAFLECGNLIQNENGVDYVDKWVVNSDNSASGMLRTDTKGIADYAFYGCQIKSVIVPDSVIFIGERMFYNNRSLTSITIGNGVTSIGDETFYNCSNLTSVTIGNSVASIGKSAFSGCGGLSEITIPDSVISVGNSAFERCGDLTSVTIESGSIGEFAFSNCSSLTSVTIGNGVTSLGEYAFAYCSGLSKITIPNSVTSIGSGAFTYCSSLSEITIPDSVTSIGDHAFSFCSGLSEITIPDSVTSIGDSAFSFCGGLSEITIPDGVTSIGDFAFSNCSGLSEITIPDSVTSIGDGAFRWCSDLASVTIGNGVTSIGSGAFEVCHDLTSVTFENARGWKAGSMNVSESSLADTSMAAEYLKATYYNYTWTRTDEE